MTGELFTLEGKRKYLTAEEQGRFIDAANVHERAEVCTLCLTLAYTGCRISEALELTADRIDLPDKSITFRTLKQRSKVKYRSVPCPDTLLDAIEPVHSVRKARRSTKLKTVALWSWGRTQATKHIWAVMEAADIVGDHASPKGLRHGFGVRMASTSRTTLGVHFAAAAHIGFLPGTADVCWTVVAASHSSPGEARAGIGGVRTWAIRYSGPYAEG